MIGDDKKDNLFRIWHPISNGNQRDIISVVYHSTMKGDIENIIIVGVSTQ